MRLYKFGLVVGRFQMLQNGHVDIINTALEMCDKVVVFIGSAQESGTEKNPFSYTVREDMLTRVFTTEVLNKRLIIRPLFDIGAGNTTNWGKYVLDVFEKEFYRQPDLYITGCEKERSSWFSDEIAPTMDELRISRGTIKTSASYCRQLILDGNYEEWCKNVDYNLYCNYEGYKKILENIYKKS